jgi:tetratricopeptide (TPR) repeat protein
MQKLILSILILVSVQARAETCSSLVDKSESQMSADMAKAAIAACKKEKVKSARPYMVLATVANSQGDYKATVDWSEKALLEEPGLGLAYMDMSSGYIGLNQYDKAVAAAKKGLEKKSEWSAKLNFNVGFALFQKAVGETKYNEAIHAEPYFLESKKIDPSLGINYYYLGVLAESVKNKPADALKLYDEGCKRQYMQACENLSKLKSAQPVASAPDTGAAKSAVATKSTPEENALWVQVEKGYLKKGIPAATVKDVVANSRKSMAELSATDRMAAAKAILESLGK